MNEHAKQPESPGRRMGEKDWQRFVEGVERSEQNRQQTVQHMQHEKLADQLRELPFRPELNERSKQLARAVEPLTDRQVR